MKNRTQIGHKWDNNTCTFKRNAISQLDEPTRQTLDQQIHGYTLHSLPGHSSELSKSITTLLLKVTLRRLGYDPKWQKLHWGLCRYFIIQYALVVDFLIVEFSFFIFNNKPETALLLTSCDPFSQPGFDHLCSFLHYFLTNSPRKSWLLRFRSKF